MKKLIMFLLIAAFAMFAFVGCADEAKTEKVNEVTVNVNAAFAGESGAEVDGVKNFKTVKEAIDCVSATEYVDYIKTINISAGSYNEKLNIPKTLTNVHFMGSASGETKITFDDFASRNNMGTDATATVTIYGDGFIANNIYFENSYDYINLNNANEQALAVYARADKVLFNKCTFFGYQDTLESVSGRQYFKDCTIKGAVDFIFGNNAASLFENCDIVSLNRGSSSGYITATKGNSGVNGTNVPTYGYVFKSCRLTAEAGVADGSISLGRPWRADSVVAWINCDMGAHISKKVYGGGIPRYTDMDGGGMINHPCDANFSEYGNTGAGATTERLMSKYLARVNGENVFVEATEPDFVLLDEAAASQYTIANIFATTNGDVTYEGEWDTQKTLAFVA